MASEQPIVSGMAGRYATALFELALEEKALDAVKADLDRFERDDRRQRRSEAAGAQPGVLRRGAGARRSPRCSSKAGIGGIAANFIKLVAANRRLFAVRDMIRAFRALVAKHKGEVTAEVTVAETLTDAHLKALKSALKAVTRQGRRAQRQGRSGDHRRARRQARQPHGRHLAPHQTQFDQDAMKEAR